MTITDGSPPAIEIAGLTKSYFDVPALAPLELGIGRGERVTMIGHNGSGKTTLIRMLTGLLEPSGGSAHLAGHEVGSIGARAAVAYIADQPVFYDDLSVWEHLDYIARLHDTVEWEQHAADLLDTVGLTARADDLPSTFSRGLKQKAAIAIAFVRPFEVLLVDEPFVGLDRDGRARLLELLAGAHADGATLVVATHELSSVRDGDRVIALADGEVTYDGSPDGADVEALTAVVPPAEPPPDD
ncbi:MAG: ABC transporter ATP-binding protein [Acidimicrobiia bacterium]|nr:ABC transporter ATP-binding protein [Acidimicrobiia bacterium]